MVARQILPMALSTIEPLPDRETAQLVGWMKNSKTKWLTAGLPNLSFRNGRVNAAEWCSTVDLCG
jgi:hypothetical protein